jgi:glycosyltransferase involved in cell wall biosynthesis
MKHRPVTLWNANNTMGFDRVDWHRLDDAATITTVSRYMKHIMWDYGVNPLVIPNGIPARLLEPGHDCDVQRVRHALGAEMVLFKAARWDPDKRWRMAVDTAAELKRRGRRSVLVARGGAEAHGAEILEYARSLQLRVQDVALPVQDPSAIAASLSSARSADIVNVVSPLTQATMQILYHASDAVLANSGREPFGLVGLEAMAAGGAVLCGQTGEEYVRHLDNAIALETDDADEAVWYVDYLADHPDVNAHIRHEARETAGHFIWERAVENLLLKARLLARSEPTRSMRSRAPSTSAA